jgi:RND family efflux transporter MFP subunit
MDKTSSSMKTANLLRTGIPLLLVILFALTGCSAADATEQSEGQWDSSSAATNLRELIPDSVVVRQEALRDRIISNGVIQGRREAVLRTRTGGVITAINFDLGQRLEAGSVLITLDDAIARLTLRQIEQQFETSLADLRSREDLFNRGSLSLAQLNQTRAAVSGLEAQLTQARDAVANTRVTTPIKGRVAEKTPGLVIGDQVQPGQQLGRIVDLDELQINIALGQSQVFLVQEGLPAEISIPTPTGQITARGIVQAVSAGSDRRTGSWTAVINFPNPAPELIRSGMSAEVVIINQNAPVTSVIPDAALVLRDGRASVFMVNEQGDPTLVPIRLVDQRGDRVAIQPIDPAVSFVGQRVLVSGLGRAVENDGSTSLR